MSESGESDRSNVEEEFFGWGVKGKLGDDFIIVAVTHFFCGS